MDGALALLFLFLLFCSSFLPPSRLETNSSMWRTKCYAHVAVVAIHDCNDDDQDKKSGTSYSSIEQAVDSR